MLRLSERTRRGLREALGIPGFLTAVTLVLLLFLQVFGAAG